MSLNFTVIVWLRLSIGGVYVLAFCRSSLKSKKYFIILLALDAIAGLGTHAAWSSNGLPRIDNKTLARLAQQHPVVVLFRHAERCDRSTNQCLSDKTGITVKGTQDARELGNAFSADIPDFDLYSSNTVRTIQSATWFSAGKKLTVEKGQQAEQIISDLKAGKFTVESIVKKERSRKPFAPFTTSSLQQDASNKLGFTTKKSMMVAQQLYEGVEIKGHGTVGLVTYIRTDSVRISAEAKAAAKDYIEHNFGQNYTANNVFSNKKKDIQDAHEAIRPSNITLDPEAIKASLTTDQYKLYKLIWTRFLASQMAAAVFDSMQVNIANGDYTLKASGSKLIFDGFQRVYNPQMDEDKDSFLPALEEGEVLKAQEITSEQKFTEPPSRFTEASLVKELEDKNIGRPSTYAPIIGTLSERKYIERQKKSLIPTELGFLVTGMMEEYFKEIVDVGFTADMEDKLDDVEVKDLNWKEIIRDFYGPFSKELEAADNAIEKVELEDVPAGEDCELCGSPMVIKSGRFGEFMACSNYPECKNTKPIVKSVGVPCPDCGSDIVAKRGRSGKIFYGCSNYPSCNRAFWYKPTTKKCPECGQLLLERKTRNSELACSNDQCKYKE